MYSLCFYIDCSMSSCSFCMVGIWDFFMVGIWDFSFCDVGTCYWIILLIDVCGLAFYNFLDILSWFNSSFCLDIYWHIAGFDFFCSTLFLIIWIMADFCKHYLVYLFQHINTNRQSFIYSLLTILSNYAYCFTFLIKYRYWKFFINWMNF